MKELIQKFLPLTDFLLIPFVYPAAWLLKNIRRAGVHKLPRCRNALMKVGVFPVRSHYYEPQFDNRNLDPEALGERNLPGIDWNISDQLRILATLSFSEELTDIPKERERGIGFYLDNSTFGPGDAEYWYQIIRKVKPKRIFEVGSGYSTLMAILAINKNRAEDPGYECSHICIEPYEMPWLEEAGVFVVRKQVEDLELSFFSQLKENDILFIDSSHIIRPRGDVLFEYLQLLPSLNTGVIVHVHDIFSPRNYPQAWLIDEVRFWNEQYLLEAFLSNNSSWQVIGALNYLHHNHYDKLNLVAPFLTPEHEPGSFYIQKIVRSGTTPDS